MKNKIFLVVTLQAVLWTAVCSSAHAWDWSRWTKGDAKVIQQKIGVAPEGALRALCRETDSFSDSVSVVSYTAGPSGACRARVSKDGAEFGVTFKSYEAEAGGILGSTDYSEAAPASVTVACGVLREAFLKNRSTFLQGHQVECGLRPQGVSAEYIGLGNTHHSPDSSLGAAGDATSGGGTVTAFSVYSNQAHVNCRAEISGESSTFEVSPFLNMSAAEAGVRRQSIHAGLNMCETLLRSYIEGHSVRVEGTVHYGDQMNAASVSME